MNNSNCIIEGSETWVEQVPDEYAIKHTEAYISHVDKGKMILKFEFVKNCGRALGTGFVKKCGLVRLPFNIGEFVEGLVICIDDNSEQPSLYYKNRKGLDYICQLNKCEVFNSVYNPLSFSSVTYYSERTIERQKCDKNAPEWLKEFAKEKGANVAYFSF